VDGASESGIGLTFCTPSLDGPCDPLSIVSLYGTSGYGSGILNEEPTLWDGSMIITGATVVESHFSNNGNLEVTYAAVGAFYAHFGCFDEWYTTRPDCEMRDISMPDTPWRVKAIFAPAYDGLYFFVSAAFRTE
jgi:hypothetical protein